MKYALVTAVCLLTLAVATPALATPLAFASRADFAARYAGGLDFPLYRGEPGSDPTLFTTHLDMIGTPDMSIKTTHPGLATHDFDAWLPSVAVTLAFSKPIVAWAIDMSNFNWLPGAARVTTNVGNGFEGKNLTSFESIRFVLGSDDPMPASGPVAAPVVAAGWMPDPATLIVLGSGLVAVATALRQSRRSTRRRRRSYRSY